MDYKTKIEELVSDMNQLISDPMMFPTQRGGRFISVFTTVNDTQRVYVAFKEGNVEHSIYASGNIGGMSEDEYYTNVYFRVLRNLLFSEDMLTTKESGWPSMLSLKTLANEGLQKLINE
jgi:hypothetical protein